MWKVSVPVISLCPPDTPSTFLLLLSSLVGRPVETIFSLPIGLASGVTYKRSKEKGAWSEGIDLPGSLLGGSSHAIAAHTRISQGLSACGFWSSSPLLVGSMGANSLAWVLLWPYLTLFPTPRHAFVKNPFIIFSSSYLKTRILSFPWWDLHQTWVRDVPGICSPLSQKGHQGPLFMLWGSTL